MTGLQLLALALVAGALAFAYLIERRRYLRSHDAWLGGPFAALKVLEFEFEALGGQLGGWRYYVRCSHPLGPHTLSGVAPTLRAAKATVRERLRVLDDQVLARINHSHVLSSTKEPR